MGLLSQLWGMRNVKVKSWEEQIARLPQATRERIYNDRAQARNEGRETTKPRPIMEGEPFDGTGCVATLPDAPKKKKGAVVQCGHPVTHVTYNVQDGWPHHFCAEHQNDDTTEKVWVDPDSKKAKKTA